MVHPDPQPEVGSSNPDKPAFILEITIDQIDLNLNILRFVSHNHQADPDSGFGSGPGPEVSQFGPPEVELKRAVSFISLDRPDSDQEPSFMHSFTASPALTPM